MLLRIFGHGLVLSLLCAALPAQADSVREILERRGVLGTWAEHCDRPVGANNDYTVYRALDAERVQRDVLNGPGKRINVGFVGTVVELSPNELQMTVPAMLDVTRNTRHSYVARLRYEGRLVRLMESTIDGKAIAVNGRYASNYAYRAWRNKPTVWISKCD